MLLEVERICVAMDKSGISYELLAIDDGSTDQTLTRLRRAEPDFPNLKVIHFPRNSGAGTVRRIGTQQARGGQPVRQLGGVPRPAALVRVRGSDQGDLHGSARERTIRSASSAIEARIMPVTKIRMVSLAKCSGCTTRS